MNTTQWFRKLLARGKKNSRREGSRSKRSKKLCLEVLEHRLVPTISEVATLGGTLDIDPVSTIMPSGYNYMAVLTTTVPGLQHGTMDRISSGSVYVWGTGEPNPFEPSASPTFNQNRVFSGEGFEYVNDATISHAGDTESIPVEFSNATGSQTTTDTLVITINSSVGAPQIVTQPAGITTVLPGQSPPPLSVVATGDAPLSYQWYSGLTPNTSNPIAGATLSTFAPPAPTLGGQYLYWVQVKNSKGVANSLNATLNLDEPTTITTSSATATYSPSDQDVTFNATVTRASGQLFGIAAGGVSINIPGVGTDGNTTDATSTSPGTDTTSIDFTIPAHTHVNTYPVTATYAGNIPLYLSSSSDSTHTLVIQKANQVITGFGPIPTHTIGDADFTINGVSATSGSEAGGVSFTSSNPAVATISGNTVHIVGLGTTTITAMQGGNGDWNPAPSIAQSLTVYAAAITPTTLPNWTVNWPGYAQTLNATGGASSLTGFGGNGTGWNAITNGTTPGPTFPSADVLQMTANTAGQDNAFWYNTPEHPSAGFTVGFTYQDQTPGAGADGVAFVLQSSLAGTTAIGGGGGYLGYMQGNVTPSIALELNIYNGQVQGGAFDVNAANTGFVYTNPGAPWGNLSSGDPINFTITYDGNLALAATALDTVTKASASLTATLPAGGLAGILGSSNPTYLGFTGGTGSLDAAQVFSNFSYVPVHRYNFSATSGTLPPGLTLSGSGVLSGTPTTVGTYTFTLTAVDVLGATTSRGYTVTINPQMSFTTTTLPNWTANGAGYSQTLGVTGGTGPLAFSSLDAPPGLTLSSGGVLSGTPTTPGTYTVDVTVVDTGLTPNYTSISYLASDDYTQLNGISGNTIVGVYQDSSKNYHGLVVDGSGTAGINIPGASQTFAEGISGSNIVGYYQDSSNHTNGFDISDQTLSGVTFSEPSATLGTWAQGVDGSNIVGYYQDGTGTHGFLENGLTWTTLDDPSATNGTYAYGISGSNIVGYYKNGSGTHGFLYNGSTWITLDDPSATPGDTNAVGISGGYIVGYFGNGTGSHGFLYNGSTYTTIDDPSVSPGRTLLGGISGGNIVGYYKDGSGGYVGFLLENSATTQSYTVTINPSVAITTTTLPNWTANIAGYSQAISATGGTGTLAFSSTGTLPPGLTLSSSGVLSGTPTSAGTYRFTVKATDSVLAGASQSCTLTINPPVAIRTTLPNWTIGFGNYNQNLGVTGGSGALTISSTGTLPPGLTLSNGVLSGTPTSPGTYNFTVTVTDYGQVSGYSTLEDLPLAPGGTRSQAISGSNIVGDYINVTGIHGFLENGSTWTTLDDPSATTGTYAEGIDGGTIVGYYLDGTGTHGFLHNGATWTTLDDPSATPGNTYAWGISGSNIVGYYKDGTGRTHGFLYNGSTWTTLDDPSDSAGTVAQGISGSNIVGFFKDGTGSHGFLYNGSTWTTLDDPSATSGTFALGISGSNIVGAYFDGTEEHGFVYNGSAFTTTLDDPGASPRITQPQGISGSNIVGYYYQGSITLGFLATLATVSQSYSVTIDPPVSVTTSTLPNWTANYVYNQTINTTGGGSANNLGVTSGTLPPGLSLSTNGVLAGTPTSPGTYTFTVTASDSGQTPLYTTLDDPSASPGNTHAQGVSGNNIVGYYGNGSGAHGFLYNGSTWTTLDDPSATSGTYAQGISRSNIVGYYGNGTGTHGFLYNGSTYTTLDDPSATPGNTYALGIDGSNIVGYYYNSGYHGFLYNGSAYTTLDYVAGAQTYAQGISGSNIVGYWTAPFISGSFLYNGSPYTQLIDPTSTQTDAFGISGGNIVGYYRDSISEHHGFLYNGSTYTTLDDPSASTGNTWAQGISGGNIVGYYQDGSGTHGFLATLSAASQSYTVTINPPVSVTTTTLPNGTADFTSYNQTIAATGGTGALTFSSTGTLPSGVTLTTGGVLAGTPTSAGTYNFTVQATDSVGASASQSYTVTINSPVSIKTSTLPNWTVNIAGYGQAISATGGTSSLTGLGGNGTGWTAITGGSTPGPTFLAADVLQMTANTGGQDNAFWYNAPEHPTAGFTVSFTYQDQTPGAGADGVAFVLQSSPAGTAAIGGAGSYLGYLNGNVTPSIALELNIYNGHVQGGAFDVNAADTGFVYTNPGAPWGSLSSGDPINFTITYDGNLALAATALDTVTKASASLTATLPAGGLAGILGSSNPTYLGFTGGTGGAQAKQVFSNFSYVPTLPYAFSETSGTLPPGWTLSTSGVFSGTPNSAGTYTFTVTATDSMGASGSQSYTVTINPPPSITTTTLPSWTAHVGGYTQTISVAGGTGALTFSSTGTLPSGMTLSSSGVLSGTPTSVGTYNFVVTATDSVGAGASQSYTLTINPGPLSKYLVNVLGSSSVAAGSGFGVTVQAADAYNNPITSYSGPASVTVSLSPATASSFPSTVAINAFGFGFLVSNVQKAGRYTITASSGSYSGSSGSLTVTAAQPAKLAFASQPTTTPTGLTLPPVSVQIQDAYGNVVTTDNSDTVSLAVASGPGAFLPASTTTAVAQNGLAIFANLTLVKPGTYTLGAQVSQAFSGPNSNAFSVTPLQVLPGSLASSPSGFSLQFNAPFLVNVMTPALYGSGFGATAAVTPTLTLTQTSGTTPSGSTLPYQVPGSLIVNTAANSLTFVETDTASLVDNGTPLLPDGTYVVTIHSSGANGLQAFNSGGGYLDGTNAGTPGHDFTATFTVGAGAAGDDVLWVPATADGPGQALSAPGENQVGGGYPVYLDDPSGSVTDVQATLSYNPALLSVTPTSTATFSVTVPTPGTAVLHYSGPALAAGTQTPLGLVSASVPSGTTSNLIPYKARDLLTLSGISLNGGALAALGSEAVHLVAYVGDADGNGTYSSNDAVLITRVALQTDTGFAAYPLVDPVIVADTDGSGFLPADAALQVNEAGVGYPTANLPIPPIPSGVHFAASIYRPHHLMEPVQNTLLPIDKAAAPGNALPATVLPVDLLMASSDLLDDVPTGLRHKRRSPVPSVALRPQVLDQYFASPSANVDS